MSESENQVKEKKKSSLGIIGLIFVLLIIVLGIGVFNNAKKSNNIDESAETAGIAHAPHETETAVSNAGDDDVTEVATTSNEFNLEAAIKPRILGNPDAPIKISEHSSFTCGHCAKFHQTNFKQIKADYVDTGKAYIIYNDFPLNGHDVRIGAITRCVPEASYFQFIQMLFETQKDWLKDDYIKYVKQNARLTGASEEQIENCLNSEKLFEALAAQREKAMNEHKVSATPTLVINDSVVIPGLSSYSELKEALDAELGKVAK